MNKILFVEDDQNLGMLLKENMDNKGFDTIWCKDGEEGLSSFKKGEFRICILDVMLPMKDGFELSKQIKKIDPDVPLIFLTSRSMQNDRIKGFEYGCDDYVTKPFNVQELYMRINAILRRSQQASLPQDDTILQIGKYTFDHNQMTLTLGSDVQKLSSKECELIYILALNMNVLVKRNVILEKVWGNDDYFSAKSMDVYISKVRKLLRGDASVEILNAYGIGFKLIVKADA